MIHIKIGEIEVFADSVSLEVPSQPFPKYRTLQEYKEEPTVGTLILHLPESHNAGLQIDDEITHITFPWMDWQGIMSPATKINHIMTPEYIESLMKFETDFHTYTFRGLCSLE